MQTPERTSHLCGQLLFIKFLETSIGDISQEKSREKTGETHTIARGWACLPTMCKKGLKVEQNAE